MNSCAITTDDINRAEAIYGSPVPYFKGHMVRRKPQVHDKIVKNTISTYDSTTSPWRCPCYWFFLCKWKHILPHKVKQDWFLNCATLYIKIFESHHHYFRIYHQQVSLQIFQVNRFLRWQWVRQGKAQGFSKACNFKHIRKGRTCGNHWKISAVY